MRDKARSAWLRAACAGLTALCADGGCRQEQGAAVPPSTAKASPRAGEPTDGPGSLESSARPMDDRVETEPPVRTRPVPAAVHGRAEAIQAVWNGNPEGARDFLADLVAKEPTDAQARYELARALRALGELKA